MRKRILLLMGPVGGGKSTIVNLLKRGLEAYSRTDEGAVYAIKGCPMHEEPLHLIPRSCAPTSSASSASTSRATSARTAARLLEDKYDGQIEDVPVERIVFSEKNRSGIGTFTPSDPK